MSLNHPNEFYETILDLFPGMISVVSRDFKVLYANEKLKKRYGNDPVGKFCYQAFHGLEAPCPWCKKDEVLDHQKSLLWEVRSPKDGRWYEVRSIPFKFGKEYAYLSVILDITEKKVLEDKLEAQLNFFREILDRNPALILFNQEGRLTFVNRTFEEITGLRKEEALGRNVFDLLVPEEDELVWRKHCDEVNRGIFKKGVELPIRTREGGKRYLLWNCMQVRDPNGRPIIIGLAVDITEQKQLFEQYLQAQKMESLGRFTGVLLHELNNLFMALQGYLGVAKLRLSDPEKVRDYLDKMEGLIERWRGMSQDLLSFARKAPGKTQSLDLAEFLNRYAETLARLLGEHIRLEIHTPGQGFFTRMNPVHLQQILLNLASNAREALEGRKGRVRITLERIVISEETASLLKLSSGPYLLLTFEDDGPGIPPEVLPHIFEPYFTTKESGTGLGLATVYALVKQYEGHIAVYSSPGKGTTFRIYFPEERRSQHCPQPLSSFSILVVEEEKVFLQTINEMMRYLGYRPYTASGFREAQELIENGLKPEVLFIDIFTRSGSTADFIRQIKKKFPDLKIIIASGYDQEVVRENLPEVKDYIYLAKPFSLDELANSLEEALSGE